MPRVYDHTGGASLALDAALHAPSSGDKAAKALQYKGYDAQSASLSPDAQRQTASAGVAGSGGALPHLDAIQASFGSHDVSGVRAHTGGSAQEATGALGAKGYAMGDAVAFNGAPDLFTAAHEAAHVVQQRAGVQLSTGVGRSGDLYERHADSVAAAVVQGKSAQGLLDQVVGQGTPAATPAVQLREGEPKKLTPAQVTSAINFNKRLPSSALAVVSTVVGSSSMANDETLVRAIAQWQDKKGLDFDGKLGSITLQWLSQEPAGNGLDAYITSNATVFMGFNPGPRDKEARTLKGRLGSQLTVANGEKQQDHATVGGVDVDLRTDAGLDAFVASFPKLDTGKRAQLKTFIQTSGIGSADELAQLCQAFYKAEIGQSIVKRVVISGHSGGWSVFGDPPNQTSVSFAHLAKLSGIFTIACGQVEDLALSACNTGQKGKLAQYKKIFPNLKSIWAYVGYSPTTPGSQTHLVKWDAGSRGSVDSDKLHGQRKEVAKGSGKNDPHVAVWTKEGSKETYATESEEAKLSYDTIKGLVDSDMHHFTAAYDNGNINASALRTLYANLQILVGNFGARLGSDHAKYELIMKRTLFLRFWAKICKNFMSVHGSTVKAGYTKASATMPDYAHGSRDKVLAWIKAYPGGTSDAGLLLLRAYLRDLDPTKIPDTWL